MDDTPLISIFPSVFALDSFGRVSVSGRVFRGWDPSTLIRIPRGGAEQE